MKWKIELYDKKGKVPVLEFIQGLSAKMQAKIFREIDLLEEYGINRTYPYTKKIEGNQYKGLWELRIKLGTDSSRIFYFLHQDNKFILLHGFMKKSNKTPTKHLKIAKQYMDEYIERS